MFEEYLGEVIKPLQLSNLNTILMAESYALAMTIFIDLCSDIPCYEMMIQITTADS